MERKKDLRIMAVLVVFEVEGMNGQDVKSRARQSRA